MESILKRRKLDIVSAVSGGKLEVTSASLDSLNIKELAKICKTLGLKGYSGLRKADMTYLIDVSIRERGRTVILESLDKQICPPVYLNDNDPITMEPLAHRKACHIFTLERGTQVPRQVYRFDSISMVNMIVSTGKIHNPLTRESLSKMDLRRLEYSYFSCLRCFSIAPQDKTIFLRCRPDINKRLIIDEHESECTFESSGAIPLDFVPWLHTYDLFKFGADCLIRARERNEFEQTDQYLMDRLTAEIDAFDIVVTMYPTSSTATVQRIYSTIITRYYVPAVLERLSVLCQWNITSIENGLKQLVLKADLVRRDFPDSFRSSSWFFLVAICVERIFDLFSVGDFFVTANTLQSQIFGAVIRSCLSRYNSNLLINESLNLSGV